MKFAEFAEYLQRLEETPKRLEITAILTELITVLDDNEVDKTIYLASGYLKAPFESQRFNIADRMMVKIIEAALFSEQSDMNTQAVIEERYGQLGDLGNVILELKEKSKSNLTILEVYEKLLETAKIEGSGSQDRKISTLSTLLKNLDPLSAKFVVRIVLGTTRLGFTELTIIDALAKLLGDNKETKKAIEAKYNIHPDIGKIAKKIKKSGIKGLNDIDIEVGVPVLSQKAQRLGNTAEVMAKLKKVWAEFKLDGTRVQLHLERNSTRKVQEIVQNDLFGLSENKNFVATYTRNLEDTTHQYPEITKAAFEQIKASSIILDGEAIGYDKKTGRFLPFQETMQRKRKYDVAGAQDQIPLKYFVFDILYLNGESLINKTLIERKKILEKAVEPGETIVLVDYLQTSNTKELQKYFDKAKGMNLEGLIAKKPDDTYQAGARSFSWVKMKVADETLLEDSIDCVVLGYYFGKGTRSKFGIGGLLVGVYDPKEDVYKTISKVGTGFTDEDWYQVKILSDKFAAKEKPTNVVMDKIYEPDVYLKPGLVVEIGADEISKSPSHSAGYALRFPRLLKFRTDKNPLESTNTTEIEEMFTLQRKGN